MHLPLCYQAAILIANLGMRHCVHKYLLGRFLLPLQRRGYGLRRRVALPVQTRLMLRREIPG